MSVRRVTIGLFLLSLPAAVAAAPNEPQRPAKGADPNEVVCEKMEVTGSRLAVKRVCMTRSEWADRRQQDRAATEKSQILGAVPQN